MLVDSEGHVDRLSMLGLCMCIVSVLLYHYVVYEHFRTYVDYQVSAACTLERAMWCFVTWVTWISNWFAANSSRSCP
jgi:hypothetical protein